MSAIDFVEPELAELDGVPDVVLRDKRGTAERGHPPAMQVSDDQVFVACHINHRDGIRHIAGSIILGILMLSFGWHELGAVR